MKSNRAQSQKQVTFKVEAKDYENYAAFAQRAGFSPYHMLKLVVESWAAAEDLLQRLESGTTNAPEAFVELGRLAGNAQAVARLNGAFGDAMGRVAAYYGMDLKSFQAGLAGVKDVSKQEGDKRGSRKSSRRTTQAAGSQA